MIEAIVSYLLMLQKNINSKQNTLKKKILHCLGDISKVFFFSVDFNPIDTNQILDIHNI